VRLRLKGTHNGRTLLGALLVLACALAAIETTAGMSQTNSPANPSTQSTAALCPVVYPDDQTPYSHGYHYTFFGNAFFINDQGYLLTVAHVMDTFRDGGQPYILVNRPDTPPRLIKVTVIARDLQHDVAILRATPNPFAGKYLVSFLSLASEPAARGESVLALSLHPKNLQNAESFEAERENTSAGSVLSYETTKLDPASPAADVFLLSHPVVKGQSGSPVLDAQTHAAVGLVEGLWLRGVTLSSVKAALPTNTPGAAVPIHYALALLQQNNIPYRSTPSAAAVVAPNSSVQ